MAFEAERVSDFPGEQPDIDLIYLNADGQPFADLYIRPEETTMVWPGAIPIRQLEHEVFRTIPDYLGCETPLGTHHDEAARITILTNDNRGQVYNGLTASGLERYHHMLEKRASSITFARFDVTATHDGAPTEYALTERIAPPDLPARFGELTLTVARNMEWSDDLLQWVLDHHTSLTTPPESHPLATPELARELGETMLRFLHPETPSEYVES